jgi:TIR domain/Pentapeptide repeats (8 copies)
MADPEQLAILRRGVKEWNAWRHDRYIPVDLGGADLRRADLQWVRLPLADLRGAKFGKANLSCAELSFANLSGADLETTNLRRAFLIGTDLRNANLHQAYFHDASLQKANLSEAMLSDTVFSKSNLEEVIGLDTIIHSGPSVIDHHTLAKSWPLPEVFLRGCGLPDSLITYLPSLLSDSAIQFYSCFISYSTKDQEFADRLYADLQNKGVRCWFAPHDVQGGKKLHEQIDAAIRMHERLLLILSPNSMNSKWVKTEIRNARKRELVEKTRVLFPVRLAPYTALRDWALFDADEGEDLATEIREYYIPDFTEWKNHDLYMKELERLLRDLRADAAVREKPSTPRL